MRWDREKLPEPNSHVYDKDDTKIIVYNVRKWQRKRWIKKRKKILKRKRLRNTLLKEELWTSDQITLVTSGTIFISHTLNFSSNPPMIVISLLESG